MAEESGIDWLKRGPVHGGTWNPWYSCAHAQYQTPDGKWHVHPGCLNCYAENQMDGHYKKCVWGSNGDRIKTAEPYWRKPLKWNDQARAAGVMLPVFPSLCDPFEDWTGLLSTARDANDVQRVWWKCDSCGEMLDRYEMPEFHGQTIPVPGKKGHLHLCHAVGMRDLRERMFRLFNDLAHLEMILFTKRPQNIAAMWPGDWFTNGGNVTLCYSASDQPTYDFGAQHLFRHGPRRAGVLGFSLEPLLAPINMGLAGTLPKDVAARWSPVSDLVGWIVIGVESNGKMVGRLGEFETESGWWKGCAAIVRECADNGVPCYVKQGPINGRVSHDPREWPDDCRVRQFPRVQNLQTV